MQILHVAKLTLSLKTFRPVSVIQIRTLQVITWTNSKAEIISTYWILEVVSHKAVWKTSNPWVTKEYSGILNSEIICLIINKGRSNPGEDK